MVIHKQVKAGLKLNHDYFKTAGFFPILAGSLPVLVFSLVAGALVPILVFFLVAGSL